MGRAADEKRTTKETNVVCAVDLDGRGATKIATGVGFLDHMLELLGRHALIDLTVQATGDTHVDAHHTVEDVGIALGTALKKALGDRTGIRRFGLAAVPMDEALAEVAIDISGRGRAELVGVVPEGAAVNQALLEGFLTALATNANMTIHAEVRRGRDAHHVIEAVFKALARSLRQAVEKDPREGGIPSTKGVL
jgi:imidazoleglycerol-phosphate dehydratase